MSYDLFRYFYYSLYVYYVHINIIIMRYDLFRCFYYHCMFINREGPTCLEYSHPLLMIYFMMCCYLLLRPVTCDIFIRQEGPTCLARAQSPICTVLIWSRYRDGMEPI